MTAQKVALTYKKMLKDSSVQDWTLPFVCVCVHVLQSYLQIDLSLVESEAGAVVSVWIDICQHNCEERGCFPVPGQPPTSRLAEL